MRRCSVFAVAAVAGLVGCGSEPAKPVEAPAATDTKTEAPDYAYGHVRAVDRDGNPIASMLPIATAEPNAFTRPVTTGELTGADGRSYLALPQGQQLYVRTWDPSFNYFANNFYTVLPNPGEATEEMVVTMLPAGRLEAKLFLPSGDPIAHLEVKLMLSHPTRGPWWPDSAMSDDTGIVVFDKVPPGEYVVRFETNEGHALEIPGIRIDPGETTTIPDQRLR